MSKIKLTGDSSGYVEISAGNAAGNNTLEAPTSGTRLVAHEGTQDVVLGGNLTVNGVLTYEDVTNIDSVGLVTARSGLHVTSGNTGIGTNNPTSALEIRTTTTNAATHYRNNASNGGAYFGVRATDLGAASAGEAYIYSYNSGINLLADGTGDINFATGGTESKVRITSGGDTELRNVVAGLTDSYSQYLKFRTTQTNNQSAVTGAIATQGKTNWGGDLVFFSKDANATPNDTVTERMRIRSDGKIGIGTADTNRVLAVYGIGNLGTQLAIVTPDTNAAGLSIEGDRRYEIQSTAPNYGAAPSSLIFYDRTANALRMAIDENGYVTKPNNPCFHATGTATGTAVSQNSTVTVPYNTEYFDVSSNFDTTNSRFTAPVTGKYFFYASVLNFPNDNTGYFTLCGAKNGTKSFQYGFARANDHKLQTDINFSTLIDLSASDTFDVLLETASGSNFQYYIAGGHGHFFGFLVQ